MVAMQVRYEYVVQTPEFDAGSAQRQLCTLAAIHHEVIAIMLHYLASRQMLERWGG